MTRITAIELENFQSIEQRTRIELKPITLLFGPNSAGKSSVFDALELIRVLLDPTMFNEELAADMVNRWARRKGDETFRETFLAIEFPYQYVDPDDVWEKDTNWKSSRYRTNSAAFNFDYEDIVDNYKLIGATVRIELQLKAINRKDVTQCFLSELRYSINDKTIVSITKNRPIKADPALIEEINSDEDVGTRYLVLFNEFDMVRYDFLNDLNKVENSELRGVIVRHDSGNCIHLAITSLSLSPLKTRIYKWDWSDGSDFGTRVLLIASDLVFYFGTVLWSQMRGKPGIVLADRRSPKPTEALTVVDLGLEGWWTRQSFSPSSPATLLMAASEGGDEHFRGLAEVAYADLLLRTANAVFWGGDRAAKYIEDVRNRSLVLEKINHHLSKNLFSEKLYKLSCAATLMVPIDLEEDDPWSYYALAQPAAVRLFLEDGDGRKVELQDVGSGIPFVLPILYAVACQGIVKVQQPELHLHPELQSSMADIFIEEFNRSGSGQFIIETHSEHVLLRLLRRIRDVEKGKCLSDDMKLTNKDIAVYYFDPQVSGGTSVTQQLVTPLGDFYTDWPRGFFGERNRDLFDE
jgi:AAA15 family ATPase/GTPase